jgi:hypothetical protein
MPEVSLLESETELQILRVITPVLPDWPEHPRPITQNPSTQKPKSKDLSVSRAHSVNGCVLMPYRLFPSIRALVAECYTPANEVQGPARQSPKNPPAAN